MLDISRRPCGGEILRGPMGKEGTPGPIKKIQLRGHLVDSQFQGLPFWRELVEIKLLPQIFKKEMAKIINTEWTHISSTH